MLCRNPEQGFRRLKHGIGIRPVYHRTSERLEAHVFACVLALLIERVAEIRAGEPWGGARRQYLRLEMVAYEGGAGRALQTTEQTPEQRKLSSAPKVSAPKLIHHVG